MKNQYVKQLCQLHAAYDELDRKEKALEATGVSQDDPRRESLFAERIRLLNDAGI